MHYDDINLDKAYTPFKAYAQSKLANVFFTRELARRLSATNVTAYSLHPGGVRTDLQRHVAGAQSCFAQDIQFVFLISPESGAQTTLYCALEPSLSAESGHYYRFVCITLIERFKLIFS